MVVNRISIALAPPGYILTINIAVLGWLSATLVHVNWLHSGGSVGSVESAEHTLPRSAADWASVLLVCSLDAC